VKWEEKWGDGFNKDGREGSRQGSEWDAMAGGQRERTWGEEHYPDGRMHKYGNSSDGSEYWDEWQDGDGGWWEKMPSFGWYEAIGHSPALMVWWRLCTRAQSRVSPNSPHSPMCEVLQNSVWPRANSHGPKPPQTLNLKP
jgi:hypothetical protein